MMLPRCLPRLWSTRLCRQLCRQLCRPDSLPPIAVLLSLPLGFHPANLLHLMLVMVILLRVSTRGCTCGCTSMFIREDGTLGTIMDYLLDYGSPRQGCGHSRKLREAGCLRGRGHRDSWRVIWRDVMVAFTHALTLLLLPRVLRTGKKRTGNLGTLLPRLGMRMRVTPNALLTVDCSVADVILFTPPRVLPLAKRHGTPPRVQRLPTRRLNR